MNDFMTTMMSPQKNHRGKSSRKNNIISTWYGICDNYKRNSSGIYKNIMKFLERDIFSDIGVSPIQRKTFRTCIRKYEKGTLKENDKRVKNRKSSYPDVEAKLLQYVSKREKHWHVDKLGLNCYALLGKSLMFSEELKYTNFKCYNGWFCNVIKRNNIKILIFHGEDNEITNEDYNIIIDEWK